jgi:PAS domain S-box-containing protein
MKRPRERRTPNPRRQEKGELRARLEEAEETLRAIREGDVDAVIVSGSRGDRVYSLTETENLYRLMVETMSEAGVAMAPDGLVIYCNARACELLQRPREQVVGRYLREYTARQDADRLDRLLQATESGVADDRLLFLAADGTAVPMRVWARRLDRADGPMICLVGTDLSQLQARQDLIDQLQQQQRQLHAEIVVREEAQVELRRNREWLRVTLTSIGDAVLVTDAEARVTFLNPVAALLTGWSEEEALGEPASRVCRMIDEYTGEPAVDVIASVLRDRRVMALGNHTTLVTRDGREVPVEDSAAPIFDARGEIVGIVLVFHDVTEKRQAQQALRAAEAHLRLAVEGANVGIWTSERDSEELHASPRARELFGFAPHEPFLRKQVFDRVHADDRERVVAAVERAWTGTEPLAIEYRIHLADGAIRWLESRGRRLDEGVHPRLYGIVADGTALKITEERTRRRIEELQTLMDITPAAILISEDPQCVRVTGNRTARELYEAGERENFAPHGSGVRFLRDGRELAAAELPMQIAAATGRAVRDTEVEALLPSGRRITVWGTATPLFDGQGNVRGCISAFADVTERKHVEEALRAARDSAERAKADAETATKAKDRFLAVLSHELRTPLAPVLTGISLLEAEPGLSEHSRQYLEILRRNVELESRLIDDLLDLTRISQGRVDLHKRQYELATIVERAVEVCRADIAARQLHFEVDWKLGPCPVEADAARLQQVFWNLLKNAIKFTPQGGCVGVRARTENGYVVVEVNDSGIGIDSATLPSIFDAFAQADPTMSRRFGGLGLGLAISKALVELHGGTIDGESQGRDKGSLFRVRLPIAGLTDATAAGVGRHSEDVPPARQTFRILLVEDHGDTATMTVKVLELEGHEVQTAGDVATALQAVDQGQFDLLISDLGLPDRSGLDLIRELRARGKAMPAIALSGYGQLQDVERSRAAGFHLHLVKPVEPSRLLEVIQTVGRNPR